MKSLFDIQSWLSQETAIILLLVLLAGIVLGIKIMQGLTHTFGYRHYQGHQGYRGGHPGAYRGQQGEYMPPRRSNFLGILISLFVMGFMLVVVGKALGPQGEPLPPNTKAVQPNDVPKAPTRPDTFDAPAPAPVPEVESVPDYVREVDEPKILETNQSLDNSYIIRTNFYKTSKEAERALDGLSNEGLPAGYYYMDYNGETVIAVFVGAYPSRDIARYVQQESKLSKGYILSAKGLELTWW